MVTLTYAQALGLCAALLLLNLGIVGLSVYAMRKQVREYRARMIQSTIGGVR